MRKLLFLISLFMLCWSCNGEQVSCDAIYKWDLVVTNKSNASIIISDNYPYSNDHMQTFAPGESKVITSFEIWRQCSDKEPAKDITADDDYYIAPQFFCIVGTESNYAFAMTIDGAGVSDVIWRDTYWSFALDPTKFFRATYTLTLTDELLESLPPAETE